jgi:hypothetical protein
LLIASWLTDGHGDSSTADATSPESLEALLKLLGDLGLGEGGDENELEECAKRTLAVFDKPGCSDANEGNKAIVDLISEGRYLPFFLSEVGEVFMMRKWNGSMQSYESPPA